MGAGVIPFAVSDGVVYFLFQTTFSGRKTGFLIDFGGGVEPGDNYRQTAIKEFIEETETMYFCDDLHKACRSAARINAQIPVVAALFDRTLSAHPDWWCARASPNPRKPRQWRSFFIEFPYRDVEPLNKQWLFDHQGRFKKRRQLHWVAADKLLAMYQHTPKKLWKRVRQLQNAPQRIRAIRQSKQS
jgi:8-oxo-dGTP pyrophosphatase MutT (NUDIX family)